tara:strand:- start:2875 stop:3846 length:972 start_codon:yes stop_codon:yes gene_type:complete
MSILIVIEESNGAVHRMSREAVVAGQALGRDFDLPVSAVLLGHDTSDLCQSLDSTQLHEILQADHPLLGSYSSDGFSRALAQVIESESPRYVIAGHTYMVRDFFPRVSAKLNIPFLADNIAYRVEGGALTLTKQILAAKLVADVAPAGDGPCIISFQSAAFQEEDVAEGSEATARQVSISLEDGSIRTTSEEPFQEAASAVDLSSAEVIVSVGRGIGKEENLPLAQELAAAMGAELAASRPVVDSGWLEGYHQIGSSGQTVAPKLYFALGISGAIQHVVGMKGSKNIVLINKDPDAPLFELADYGVVGDLLEIVPKLKKALQA